MLPLPLISWSSLIPNQSRIVSASVLHKYHWCHNAVFLSPHVFPGCSLCSLTSGPMVSSCGSSSASRGLPIPASRPTRSSSGGWRLVTGWRSPRTPHMTCKTCAISVLHVITSESSISAPYHDLWEQSHWQRIIIISYISWSGIKWCWTAGTRSPSLGRPSLSSRRRSGNDDDDEMIMIMRW